MKHELPGRAASSLAAICCEVPKFQAKPQNCAGTENCAGTPPPAAAAMPALPHAASRADAPTGAAAPPGAASSHFGVFTRIGSCRFQLYVQVSRECSDDERRCKLVHASRRGISLLLAGMRSVWQEHPRAALMQATLAGRPQDAAVLPLASKFPSCDGGRRKQCDSGWPLQR